MADLHTRLMILLRQREARDASRHELDLLQELADELTRLQIEWIIHEGAANALVPPLPTLRQGVEALRDELRAEAGKGGARAMVRAATVITNISGRLDALLKVQP